MVSAIELFLDQETCRHIRGAWKRLYDLGIGSPLFNSGAFPHITLSIYDNLGIEAAKNGINLLTSNFSPFELELTSIGTFREDKNVVYIRSNNDPVLYSMKTIISSALESTPAQEWHYSKNEQWLPHVTLAIDVPEQEMKTAIEITADLPLPIRSTVLKVGIVQLNPLKHLISRDL